MRKAIYTSTLALVLYASGCKIPIPKAPIYTPREQRICINNNEFLPEEQEIDIPEPLPQITEHLTFSTPRKETKERQPTPTISDPLQLAPLAEQPEMVENYIQESNDHIIRHFTHSSSTNQIPLFTQPETTPNLDLESHLSRTGYTSVIIGGITGLPYSQIPPLNTTDSIEETIRPLNTPHFLTPPINDPLPTSSYSLIPASPAELVVSPHALPTEEHSTGYSPLTLLAITTGLTAIIASFVTLGYALATRKRRTPNLKTTLE